MIAMGLHAQPTRRTAGQIPNCPGQQILVPEQCAAFIASVAGSATAWTCPSMQKCNIAHGQTLHGMHVLCICKLIMCVPVDVV